MERIQPVLTPAEMALADQMAERKGSWLGADELELVAKELATASGAAEAAPIRERLTRGFYGLQAGKPLN